ncbi:hypothetical protein POTOM_036290 [Populus tomentosa]|uniref:Uncharacterized protein n=1 Tax=Populus tomentosa TaxID=118781 RepID=A0A8X8CMW7_POPTO|nr:hypothetical protein POTOM_036290 [Populus tomentosa]
MDTEESMSELNVEIFEVNNIDPLTVSLYQMDFGWNSIFVEIVSSGSPSKGSKFLCFVTIEKYLFYILKTDEYLNRFSKQDQMFARRCTDDLGRHLDDTVLARLPDNYQSTLKQSITSEEDDMGTQFFSKSFLHLF